MLQRTSLTFRFQHVRRQGRDRPSPRPSLTPAPTGPVTTLRLGRIKATVWENTTDNRKFWNVTFSRTYLDEERRFHDTDSFGRDDLPLVAKLADEAHTFIYKRLAEQKSGAGE